MSTYYSYICLCPLTKGIYHKVIISYKPLTAKKMNLSKTKTQNIYKEYKTPHKDDNNVQMLGGEYWYN